MNRRIILWAAVFGGVAVVLGALGAHALKEGLTSESLQSFNSGVRYQAWHAIALLVIGFSEKQFPFKKLVFIFWSSGVILFSGSIFLLSTKSMSGLEFSFLGSITPIGGLLMILGWAFLFIGAFRKIDSHNQGVN